MKNLIFVAAAFTAIGAFPAAAAGCGMMDQTAATGAAQGTPAGSGMMCGASTEAAPQSVPGQSPTASGGCPCCAKMASMKTPDEKDGSMPGMEMPAMPPATGQ